MSKLTDGELIEELHQRMAEKSRALDELKILNRRLHESEKLKSHFISNITNEIVNPFASILGLSKNILSVDKENWKKVFSMVAMIHSEAFSLDFQLKNIFAAASIEAGEMVPEIGQADIRKIVKNVTESFRIEATKKKVVIETVFNEGDKLSCFKSDPEKLTLILSNLINNAVKFSFEKNRVLVTAGINSEMLEVSVLNKGAQISDEYRSFIFDRFKRIDSEITSINRGHGLGLSIIKSLLDLLEGEIQFQSEDDGTIFTFKVPEGTQKVPSFATSIGGNELFFDDDNQVF
ncbi:MAG TPA: HAMP domain-containing sensor histidine kinase [Bacteroidales bacterium]|nr:HAMP domain-containing sensor histidine kinase [Bacteroidales bacterium]